MPLLHEQEGVLSVESVSVEQDIDKAYLHPFMRDIHPLYQLNPAPQDLSYIIKGRPNKSPKPQL